MASVPSAFAEIAARQGGRVAISDGERRLTFTELDRRRRAAARGLMALGLAKGDRVALWAGNSLEWIVAALAVQSAGGVLVPVSARFKSAETAAVMASAGARLLICDRSPGELDPREAGGTPDHIVSLDDHPDDGPMLGWPALLARAEAIPMAALEARASSIGPNDLADIIFTSGTTGRPKGVPMTHAQCLASCEVYADVLRLTPDDVFAVAYPFAHNAGYRSGWLAALLRGARALAVRDTAPQALLALIQAEGATYLPGVPTLHQALLDHPGFEDFDLSSLRAASTGATVIPVPLIARMRGAYGCPILTGYGLTEAAGTVTHCGFDDDDETIATTVGRPIPAMEVVLLEAGEIAIRGPTVMTGYHQDPAATALAMTADGFLRTGDVGVFDARGNLKITGRLKDMYIVGGFNCYPAEVEQQLCAMPGVAMAAVVGVDDARLGQVGHAFVVPAPGAALSEAEVIAWARERMANYKVPRRVVFLDALPLNATGKVAKDMLRRP